MKLLFAFLYLGCMAGNLANQLSEIGWEEFKLQFNKYYNSLEEELQRKQIFLKAQEEVKAHNALYDQGVHTYTIGINAFSDKFPEEMEARKCLRLDLDDSEDDVDPFDIDIDSDVPDSIDWREKGAVTEVKDQGLYCGSCWAFSATGALEGQHFLKTKKLVSLSEQNLIDCDYNDYGCDGGWPSNAFKYVKKNGGIDTETSYPYKAEDGECHYNATTSGAKSTGFGKIHGGNENLLKAAVAKIGPISVLISVNDKKFRKYHGGVYYDPDCEFMGPNHAVLAVGYGTTPNGTDYWIVKNSWGEDFGLKGYILMSRNRENNCYIASYASYPK